MHHHTNYFILFQLYSNQYFCSDNLDNYQKLKLVDGLQSMVYQKDEFILKEGEEGKEFYIIESGEVECMKIYHLKTKIGFVHVRTLY